jgi:membrane associated rhomboid family serine protease
MVPAPSTVARRPMPAPARALVVVAVLLGIMWVVQVADSLTHYSLLSWGIVPRRLDKLEDVLTAPFIHVSYTHLIDNSLPLLILGFIAALRGIGRWLAVTVVIVLVSGVGVWLTATGGSDTVGASGVIFGYFGFLVARGLLDRRVVDLAIGLAVGVLYWTLLPGVLPGHNGVSWQAHLFGLLGGILAAWLFRVRSPATAFRPVRW